MNEELDSFLAAQETIPSKDLAAVYTFLSLDLGVSNMEDLAQVTKEVFFVMRTCHEFPYKLLMQEFIGQYPQTLDFPFDVVQTEGKMIRKLNSGLTGYDFSKYPENTFIDWRATLDPFMPCGLHFNSNEIGLFKKILERLECKPLFARGLQGIVIEVPQKRLDPNNIRDTAVIENLMAIIFSTLSGFSPYTDFKSREHILSSFRHPDSLRFELGKTRNITHATPNFNVKVDGQIFHSGNIQFFANSRGNKAATDSGKDSFYIFLSPTRFNPAFKNPVFNPVNKEIMNEIALQIAGEINSPLNPLPSSQIPQF